MQDLNQDPLACASRNGDVEEVLRLLDCGHNPNIGPVLSRLSMEVQNQKSYMAVQISQSGRALKDFCR